MRPVIRSFAALFVLILISQTLEAKAQLINDDWLNDAFVKPLPGKSSDGKTVTKDKGTSIKGLLNFMKGKTFLSPGDVSQYSKNLDSLVGNYFVVRDDGSIELSGTTVVSQAKRTEIPEGIVFSAIVDRKFNAGAKYLPFLSIDMTKNDLASLKIREVVTVRGSTNVDMATCNIPIRFLGKPDVKIGFITLATVTMIQKKTFRKREQKGTGLISILSLNGKNFYSSDIEERVPVISISSIAVTPIDPAYKQLCAKYNDAYKSIQVAAATPKTKIRALRALRSVRVSKEQQALNDAQEKLSKVIKKPDGKLAEAIGGKVVRIAR